MPIEFHCPHCGHGSLVDDRFAGGSGPCAVCGRTITVPTLEQGRRERLYRHSTRPRMLTLLAMIGSVGLFGLLLLGLLAALLVPFGQVHRTPASVEFSRNNLRQIGLAMHNYHFVYDTFPPAYLTDEQGKPAHSWRVLLLPYLGEEHLHSRYRFDEPWDGPNNRRLHGEIVSVYRAPSDGGADVHTSYLVVVGDPTLFPPDGRAVKIGEVRDGLSSTILAVESHVSGIHWMEPRDLDFDTMTMTVDDFIDPGIRSADGGGAAVLLADAAVHPVPQHASPETVRAALTRAGGEPHGLP